MGTNITAIVVAGVASYVASFIYYSPFLFGGLWFMLDDTAPVHEFPALWKVGFEVLRTTTVAFVLALLLAKLGANVNAGSAFGTGVLIWLGYVVLTWAGAVVWQKIDWRLAALHSGEALLKMAIMTIIIGSWH